MGSIFETNFSNTDWFIVGIYLAGSVGVGLIANRYIRKLSDFLVAGRQLRLFLAIATMTGTELGLVTLMYSGQEGFTRGMSALHIGVIECICVFGIGASGLIIRRLRQEGVMTIPEFYGRRFGRSVRVLGAAILVGAGILNMGLFLQAGAYFVAGVTGVSSPLGLKLIMTVLLLLVLVYTTLGGMVSVVITDYIQFVVLSAGVGVVTYFGLTSVGWNNLFEIVAREKGTAGMNPLVNPNYGWAYIMWMFLVSFCGGAIWQTANVRALAAKTTNVAQRMYRWSSLSFLARRSFPTLWGACAFAFIVNSKSLASYFSPDNPQALNSLYAMPIFIAKVVPAGLLGLVTAGMLAAFMSTHDSYLLCWSSVLTQDVIAPLVPWELSDKARIALTRVGIVLIGVFLLIWGLWYQASVTMWTYMAVTGTIYFAGALPVLIGGLYWRRTSTAGATAALLCGLTAVLTLLPWQRWVPQFAGQASQLVGIATFALAGVALVAGSLLFPDRHNKNGSAHPDGEIER